MKKIMNQMMMLVLVVLVGFVATGCSQKPGLQYWLRGEANAPYIRYEPLQIDPNKLAMMPRKERQDMIKYINWYNGKYAPQALANDRKAAQNAQIWTGDTNQDRYNSAKQISSRAAERLINKVIDSLDF
ncbi:MAG TPA: hypothetical protein EYG99_02365 [Candidatus Pacebacteria bacterium]|nr:hypothetical protein [Candidatus Paceibacterota bacterium]